MPVSRYEKLDEKLDKVIASLGESRETLAGLKEHVGSLDNNMESYANHVKEQNGRVRKLENWRWMLVGGWFILSGVMGYFFTKVFEHITH
jgi:hypothetical protein